MGSAVTGKLTTSTGTAGVTGSRYAVAQQAADVEQTVDVEQETDVEQAAGGMNMRIFQEIQQDISDRRQRTLPSVESRRQQAAPQASQMTATHSASSSTRVLWTRARSGGGRARCRW